MTNRYKLIFEYEGTEFNGWQKQPIGRTVEGEIEKGFSQIFQFDVDIIGQGRTDAGVHAIGQVAHVDLPPIFTSEKLIHAMKGILPDDIALHSVIEVDKKFHARFDALAREYKYQAVATKSPLQRRVSWILKKEPDIVLLQQLAADIMGTHDFVNFCVPSDDSYQTTICTISKSRWDTKGKHLIFTIQGNRFLRHMVRRLAGSMIHVATGRLSPEKFTKLLKGSESKLKAFSAPAKGLMLTKVLY